MVQEYILGSSTTFAEKGNNFEVRAQLQETTAAK